MLLKQMLCWTLSCIFKLDLKQVCGLSGGGANTCMCHWHSKRMRWHLCFWCSVIGLRKQLWREFCIQTCLKRKIGSTTNVLTWRKNNEWTLCFGFHKVASVKCSRLSCCRRGQSFRGPGWSRSPFPRTFLSVIYHPRRSTLLFSMNIIVFL